MFHFLFSLCSCKCCACGETNQTVVITGTLLTKTHILHTNIASTVEPRPLTIYLVKSSAKFRDCSAYDILLRTCGPHSHTHTYLLATESFVLVAPLRLGTISRTVGGAERIGGYFVLIFSHPETGCQKPKHAIKPHSTLQIIFYYCFPPARSSLLKLPLVEDTHRSYQLTVDLFTLPNRLLESPDLTTPRALT